MTLQFPIHLTCHTAAKYIQYPIALLEQEYLNPHIPIPESGLGLFSCQLLSPKLIYDDTNILPMRHT